MGSKSGSKRGNYAPTHELATQKAVSNRKGDNPEKGALRNVCATASIKSLVNFPGRVLKLKVMPPTFSDAAAATGLSSPRKSMPGNLSMILS